MTHLNQVDEVILCADIEQPANRRAGKYDSVSMASVIKPKSSEGRNAFWMLDPNLFAAHKFQKIVPKGSPPSEAASANSQFVLGHARLSWPTF